LKLSGKVVKSTAIADLVIKNTKFIVTNLTNNKEKILVLQWLYDSIANNCL